MNGGESTNDYRIGPTTVKCGLRKIHVRNIFVRNKGNTTLKLEHRRLKGVGQAVIKNAARDDHLRDFCSTLDRMSSSCSKPLQMHQNAPF